MYQLQTMGVLQCKETLKVQKLFSVRSIKTILLKFNSKFISSSSERHSGFSAC